MNINHINTFLAVVQHGNFTAAANALYISQPAASMHISALEKYYGCTLLLRNKNCVTLTPAGKVLFEDSKKIVAILHNTESEINYILNNVSGSIHFGASQTIGEYFLPAFLKHFSEKYQAKLTMLVDNTKNILNMLRSDKIEIGLVEGTIDDTYYDTNHYLTEVFAYDEMGVVVPADHALAELHCVHIEDLLRFPLVVREEGSGTRKIFEKEIEKKGYSIKPSIIMNLGSTETIKASLKMTGHISVLSRLTVQSEIGNGIFKVVPICDIPLSRTFKFIVKHSSLQSFKVRTFREDLFNFSGQPCQSIKR